MTRRRAIRLARFASIIVGVQLLSAAVALAPANAYDRNKAVAYANTWWDGRNPNYPHAFSDDCTNFISQALNHGGIAMRWPSFGWTGHLDSDVYWVGIYTGAGNEYTTSWSVAKTSHTFLKWNLGNTSEVTIDTRPNNPPNTVPNPVTDGDIVYYNWGDLHSGSGDGIDHASIVVGNGTDPQSGASGTLINEHTSDRRHAIWDLWPYNAAYRTTTSCHLIHVQGDAS
jgi:hypothetical protein